jgi:hypothetical protein
MSDIELRFPQVAVEWVVLLFCIRDVPDSYFDPEAGCLEGFLGFRQVFQANS